MWRRVTCVTEVTSGAVWTRKAAKDLKARSAPVTLPGRNTQAICSR
jgi:hypothetical protein